MTQEYGNNLYFEGRINALEARIAKLETRAEKRSDGCGLQNAPKCFDWPRCQCGRAVPQLSEAPS